jgi:hypothetical protein
MPLACRCCIPSAICSSRLRSSGMCGSRNVSAAASCERLLLGMLAATGAEGETTTPAALPATLGNPGAATPSKPPRAAGSGADEWPASWLWRKGTCGTATGGGSCCSSCDSSVVSCWWLSDRKSRIVPRPVAAAAACNAAAVGTCSAPLFTASRKQPPAAYSVTSAAQRW